MFSLPHPEAKAYEQLAALIRDPLVACRLAQKIGIAALRPFGTKPLVTLPYATNTALVIMGRLITNVRCVAFVAEIGYGESAVGLTSTTFEMAHTLAYIGFDEARAKAWARHRNPKKTFLPIEQIVRGSISAMGLPITLHENEYRTYRQLCWGKHAQPFLPVARAPEDWESGGVLKIGPDTSDSSVRAIWYALFHAARLQMFAVDAFALAHAPILKETLAEEYALMRAIYEKVNQNRQRTAGEPRTRSRVSGSVGWPLRV